MSETTARHAPDDPPPSGCSPKLIIDGACPFCRTERDWLRRRDPHGRLDFVDLNDPAFDPAAYGVSREAVDARIHAVLPDGRIVTGMDAIRAAYEAVGLGWITAPTRWPGLRWLFDRAYDLFARNRIRWGGRILRLSARFSKPWKRRGR